MKKKEPKAIKFRKWLKIVLNLPKKSIIIFPTYNFQLLFGIKKKITFTIYNWKYGIMLHEIRHRAIMNRALDKLSRK